MNIAQLKQFIDYINRKYRPNCVNCAWQTQKCWTDDDYCELEEEFKKRG